MSDKMDNVELRIILIGEAGVGKKSMVKRFKILNCTETKEFTIKKPVEKKDIKKVNEKNNKNKNNANVNTLNDTISKTKTKSESEEITKEEIEQKKWI